MFYYDLEHAPERSLYEALTACIRRDIQNGHLEAGSRLPSKRRAAADLGVSVVTVQGAYEQLLAEGYIVSYERKGYFVANLEHWEPHRRPVTAPNGAKPAAAKNTVPADGSSAPVIDRDREWDAVPDPDEIDLVQSSLSPELFPMSVWSRLSNRVYRGEGARLLRRMPYNGLLPLREAIADILYKSRGILATPDQILVSAGNEQLYADFLAYFGRDRVFGVENPGHRLIARLYASNGAAVRHLPMDESGVIPGALSASDTDILHISPAHHFPSGVVTPIARRQAFLSWAGENPRRYIIEDDYDSEFRMAGRPIPSLQQMDDTGRVIYINTFSKTIAPALRVAYAVMPPEVAADYRERFGFLSCPVTAASQLILAAFIREGYFERHINRMRTRYRALRDCLLSEIAASPRAARYTVSQADSGLHFLLRVATELSDRALVEAAGHQRLRVLTLNDYAADPVGESHTLVISYGGLTEAQIPPLVKRLDAIG